MKRKLTDADVDRLSEVMADKILGATKMDAVLHNTNTPSHVITRFKFLHAALKHASRVKATGYIVTEKATMRKKQLALIEQARQLIAAANKLYPKARTVLYIGRIEVTR